MSEQVCLAWQVSMTVSACVLDGRTRLAMPSTTASTPSTPHPRLTPLCPQPSRPSMGRLRNSVTSAFVRMLEMGRAQKRRITQRLFFKSRRTSLQECYMRNDSTSATSRTRAALSPQPFTSPKSSRIKQQTQKRYTLPGISVSMKDRAQETCACEFYSQQR